MTDEKVGKLRRRLALGVFWAVLYGVTAVTILALVADTNYWNKVVRPAPVLIRMAFAATIIGVTVYLVSVLITRRRQDYAEAKCQSKSDRSRE